MWKYTSWAMVVPTTASAATERIASQPGTASGSWKSANGQQQPADEHAAGGEHGAGHATKSKLRVRAGARVGDRRADDGERSRNGPPAARQVDAGQYADAHESEATPTQRMRATCSCGRKRRATRNAKIGTVAWAMPATVESMCFSPQAMSQNGNAALNTPNTNVGRPAARSRDTASAPPRVHEEGEQQDARTRHLADIITLGSRSSTATLMKKYELPQSPASSSSQGT